MLPTSETELSWAIVTTLSGGPDSQRPQGPTGAPTSLSHPVQALDPVQLARAMVSCFPHALDLLALCSVLCKGPHPHARASFNPLLFGGAPPQPPAPQGPAPLRAFTGPPPEPSSGHLQAGAPRGGGALSQLDPALLPLSGLHLPGHFHRPPRQMPVLPLLLLPGSLALRPGSTGTPLQCFGQAPV